VPHVEPPFELIASMVTLRAHLDDCNASNAPLLIAPGSHRSGRVPEKDIPQTVARLGQAICLAAAGDVWLYATSILHASERAERPRRRRVLHVDFASAALPGGLDWYGFAMGD
jgi:ectoine hydroxylase-related dioxygenase (phytanoyl-CoA dioxygenase family)